MQPTARCLRLFWRWQVGLLYWSKPSRSDLGPLAWSQPNAAYCFLPKDFLEVVGLPRWPKFWARFPPKKYDVSCWVKPVTKFLGLPLLRVFIVSSHVCRFCFGLLLYIWACQSSISFVAAFPTELMVVAGAPRCLYNALLVYIQGVFFNWYPP